MHQTNDLLGSNIVQIRWFDKWLVLGGAKVIQICLKIKDLSRYFYKKVFYSTSTHEKELPLPSSKPNF
jgi:hypothetical protein